MKISTIAKVAHTVSAESKCISMKVGAVLVKDGRIISTGTNGTAPGYYNCCDTFSVRGPDHSEWSAKFETHAELSCMLHCPVPISGATMVTTHSPCWECTKNMVLAGVKEIWFTEKYYRMTDDDYDEVKDYCKKMDVLFKEIPSSEDGV